MSERNTAELNLDDIPATIRNAGVAGAGGAGFPSATKWESLDDIHSLMINHQESEPNYYTDKWLGQQRADELAAFFDELVDSVFDRVVIGTKEKYREKWCADLESATGATVYGADELPADASSETGVVIAYTADMYDFSEEQALLMIAAGERIGRDLPTEHGWIVHNTESIYNIHRALADGTPVTRKYVHVDGNTPRHRCLEVPIGTTATALLDAAGIDASELADDQVLTDGGPGWSYVIDEEPDSFGVRKRTNAILVLDEDVVDEHTEQEGRINVLDALDWNDREHETEPTKLESNLVRIPLITNAAYEGLVHPSEPVVDVGETVSEGDVIATPSRDGISNTQHASIDGEITDVTATHVVIERV